MLVDPATAVVRGPGRVDLGEDPLSENVPWPCQGKGNMGVQALQAAPPRRASDPELERRAGIASLSAARQLAPYCALLVRTLPKALGQLSLTFGGPAPALDSPRRFKPRNGGDEM